MKTPYDPKLREAMAEIGQVLIKYDCMASVILASPTHSEYLFVPDAAWSVAKWEGDGENRKLRFRSKLVDFPSKEAQHTATEATVHGISSIQWLSAKMYIAMNDLIEDLRKHMTILTDVGGLMGKPDSVPGDGK